MHADYEIPAYIDNQDSFLKTSAEDCKWYMESMYKSMTQNSVQYTDILNDNGWTSMCKEQKEESGGRNEVEI